MRIAIVTTMMVLATLGCAASEEATTEQSAAAPADAAEMQRDLRRDARFEHKAYTDPRQLR